MKAPSFHLDPEFVSLVPEPDADTLQVLEESLKTDGCMDPIVVWAEEQILLDGHHRYEICKRLGIDFDVRLKSLPDRDHAILWVLQHHLARRNLTPFQRTEIALRTATILAAIGRQRQQDAGGDRRSSRKKSSDTKKATDGPFDKREHVAAIAGVSNGTIDHVKRVLDHGIPALQQAARSGDISVAAASELADLAPEEQEQAVAAGPAEARRVATQHRSSKRDAKAQQRQADPLSMIQHAVRATPDLERRAPFAIYTLTRIWDESLREPGYGGGECIAHLDRLTTEERALVTRYLRPMHAWLADAVAELDLKGVSSSSSSSSSKHA
ncbi:parB-like nuclease domain protein [bacterium BMS3Bbin13]|nr:parB-like nuclease domain protein [bacterium BMS3Bbin13]